MLRRSEASALVRSASAFLQYAASNTVIGKKQPELRRGSILKGPQWCWDGSDGLLSDGVLTTQSGHEQSGL